MARSPRSLLEQIAVREPCSADWESMPGHTSRFCGSCQQNVHDLSELSVSDAEDFLERHRGQTLCVRLAPLPKRRLALIAAALLVASCAPAPKPTPPPPKGGKTMGCICVPGDPLCSCL